MRYQSDKTTRFVAFLFLQFCLFGLLPMTSLCLLWWFGDPSVIVRRSALLDKTKKVHIPIRNTWLQECFTHGYSFAMSWFARFYKEFYPTKAQYQIKICIFAPDLDASCLNDAKSICKRSSLKLPVSKKLVDMILMPLLVWYVMPSGVNISTAWDKVL